MIPKHQCPCCSLPLLRHISSHRIYWFCSYCHQEMPVIENGLETKSGSQLGISQVREYQHWIAGWRLSQRQFSGVNRLGGCDRLTQLANRDQFEAYIEQEWRRMAREQAPLSLILCDIDFFKKYNESYGKQAGDQCLQQVAQAISTAVKRPADLVARYGGEKFAVVLPNTKAEGAVCVAEEIRSRVKTLHIVQANLPGHSLTLSSGVASLIPSYEYSPAMMVTAAASALYQAKLQGRDRVMLHEQLLRQTQLLEVEETLVLQ